MEIESKSRLGSFLMSEDKLLLNRFKRGDMEALRQIYEKYKRYLMALALSFTGERGSAEDVVHDVFVSFAEIALDLKLRSSLKGYLSTSVVNRVRGLRRGNKRAVRSYDWRGEAASDVKSPEGYAIFSEEAERIERLVGELPFEQREVVMLHLQSGLKFREIAKCQRSSVNTVISRYRYGLEKIRSKLNGELK